MLKIWSSMVKLQFWGHMHTTKEVSGNLWVTQAYSVNLQGVGITLPFGIEFYIVFQTLTIKIWLFCLLLFSHNDIWSCMVPFCLAHDIWEWYLYSNESELQEYFSESCILTIILTSCWHSQLTVQAFHSKSNNHLQPCWVKTLIQHHRI